MLPVLVKILPYLVAAITSVSLLGPVAAPWVGIVPAKVTTDILSVVGWAGALHLWLSTSPLAALLARRKLAAEVAKLGARVASGLVIVVGLAACSWLKSAPAQAAVNDVGGLAACVIQHIETDPSPNAGTIVAECTGVVLADVIQISASLENAPADAGVPPVASPIVARARAVRLSAVGSGRH